MRRPRQGLTISVSTFRRVTNRRRPIKLPAAARFDRPSPLRYPCGREERWPSGRRRTPGKCVTPNRVRGFESHPLRQHVSEVIHLLTFKVQFVERRGVSLGFDKIAWSDFGRAKRARRARARMARVYPTLSANIATCRSMVARVCIFATTGHEPRQARKGAAVEALSRAPKSCWRGPPPQSAKLRP